MIWNVLLLSVIGAMHWLLIWKLIELHRLLMLLLLWWWWLWLWWWIICSIVTLCILFKPFIMKLCTRFFVNGCRLRGRSPSFVKWQLLRLRALYSEWRCLCSIIGCVHWCIEQISTRRCIKRRVCCVRLLWIARNNRLCHIQIAISSSVIYR